MYPATTRLPSSFVDPILELEQELGTPVWLLVQPDHRAQLPDLDWKVLKLFLDAREEIERSGPPAILIDTPGGSADVAYRIARMLSRCCGGFSAVIPRYAKSAGTLLTLGATSIYLGQDAELGPLDAQVWDDEREERSSALDEVQALEQLHNEALRALDYTMMVMRMGTRRRSDVLLPHAISLVSNMMQPLLDKIDTVHYARQARVLKQAEEYAVRLLQPHVGPARARQVADHFVNRYPHHGFVIDREEAQSWLNVVDTTREIDVIMRRIDAHLWNTPTTAFGRLKEMTS